MYNNDFSKSIQRDKRFVLKLILFEYRCPNVVNMDVLNKFRSTVTNTMSQLSTVLPGNPVTREYEATKHIASAGVGV